MKSFHNKASDTIQSFMKNTKSFIVEIGLIRFISMILLSFGSLFVIISIFASSSIISLIGLGFILFGIISLYITKDDSLQLLLLEKTSYSLLYTIKQIISDLDFKGPPIYLPPKHLNNPGSSKVLISRAREPTLDHIKVSYCKDDVILKFPDCLLIVPPGADLAKLFEKILNIDFIKTDFKYIEQNIPDLIVNTLSLAKDFKIKIKHNIIETEVENSSFLGTHKKNDQNDALIDLIGCPLCSAIAIALAKSTGKFVTINNQTISNNIITTSYYLIAEEL